MKKLFDKNPIWAGIGVGYSLSILFVLLEKLLWDFAYTDKWWIYIDGVIRLLFGVVGLFILKAIYADKFWELFKKKIGRNVLLYLIPIFLYFILEFLFLACAKQIQTPWIAFFIMWITQVTTGFWEEAVSRGVVMSGMLMKWKDTVRGRILSVVISGVLFGSLHILNVIFGNNIIDCLWNGLSTFCWGMFIAAIYMLSENLLLVMGIHAVWDIIIRIPGYFISEYNESVMLTGIYAGQDIIELGIMPIVAILICIFGYKEKKQ